MIIGFRRRDFLANEAAMKYFLLGAFAIAFFLYGMSIIYGLCGTMNFKGIAGGSDGARILPSRALSLRDRR